MGKFIGLLYYVLWAVYAGLKICGVVDATWFVVWAFAWGPFAAAISVKIYTALNEILDFCCLYFRAKNTELKKRYKKP